MRALLRFVGGLVLALLLLVAAGLCFLLLDHRAGGLDPYQVLDPYGSMPHGWQPVPRTIVHDV
jgi:hypothetical protein